MFMAVIDTICIFMAVIDTAYVCSWQLLRLYMYVHGSYWHCICMFMAVIGTICMYMAVSDTLFCTASPLWEEQTHAAFICRFGPACNGFINCITNTFMMHVTAFSCNNIEYWSTNYSWYALRTWLIMLTVTMLLLYSIVFIFIFLHFIVEIWFTIIIRYRTGSWFLVKFLCIYLVFI